MFFGNGYRVCTAKIDADALVRLLPKAKVLTRNPCGVWGRAPNIKITATLQP